MFARVPARPEPQAPAVRHELASEPIPRNPIRSEAFGPRIRAMRRTLAMLLLLTSSSLWPAFAQEFGMFVGSVQSEWLDDGRRMRLLAPFAYIDPRGLEWEAPAGSIVDGASIPQFAWSLLGGPFEGKYRNASVIHDVACDQQARPWEAVHEAFYWAMRASGVETIQARMMYAIVYHFGPRWTRRVQLDGIPMTGVEAEVRRVQAEVDARNRAYVAAIQIRPRTSDEIIANQPERADVTIDVTPVVPSLSAPDLYDLLARIEQRETSPRGQMSLEEIRDYAR